MATTRGDNAPPLLKDTTLPAGEGKAAVGLGVGRRERNEEAVGVCGDSDDRASLILSLLLQASTSLLSSWICTRYRAGIGPKNPIVE